MSDNNQHLSHDESVQNLPSGLTDVQLGGEKGLLSTVGDPLGKALDKGLSPVGNAVGGLTNGGYSKAKEMDKPEQDQSVGGKEQNGQNPLGL